MRIGEAARRVDLEASAIRFYESAGLLPVPKRTANGYRNYAADDIELMRFVKQARSLGIPIDDVRQIVALRDRGEAPCSFVRQVLDREARLIDRRITELRALQDELAVLRRRAADGSDDWEGGTCVCHVIASAGGSGEVV